MSRIKDPAFYQLRTKALPTLPKRRRFVWEMLAKRRADLVKLLRLGVDPDAIKKRRPTSISCAGHSPT